MKKHSYLEKRILKEDKSAQQLEELPYQDTTKASVQNESPIIKSSIKLKTSSTSPFSLNRDLDTISKSVSTLGLKKLPKN